MSLLMDKERVFKDTIDEYGGFVKGYLHNELNNYEDAEDVSQEVFKDFWKALDTFRKASKPSTVLFTITRRRKADYLRAKYRLLPDVIEREQDVESVFSESRSVLNCVGEVFLYRINVMLFSVFSALLNEEQVGLLLAMKKTIINRFKE